MNIFRIKLIASLLALAVSACAQNEKQPTTSKNKPLPDPSMEAKQLAADEQAPWVAELTFDKGKSDLKKVSQKQLSHLVHEVQTKGSDVEIKIVSWADEEYPSVHTKKLNTDQVELAIHRGQSVKKYLENQGITKDITNYNMAERPGTMSELFSTSNARIKRALEIAGIPNTHTNVKDPKKAGKAIVLIISK